MSYALNGLVDAAGFNTMVTGYANGTNNPAVAALNSFWSVGNQNKGYGQTATVAANVNEVVAVGKWANLVANTASAATHQGSSITSVAVPVVGGTITYLSAIPTNLTTVYNNRLNAATQGSTSSNTMTYGTTWQNAITFTHTVTFASGDEARYFFNAGGQLAITAYHPTGSTINLLMSTLASNIGTVVLSAPTSGSVTIAGGSYNGVTKVGGGAPSPTIATNAGYFALTSTNTSIFTQTASTGPAGYLSTFIEVLAKVTGDVGSNGAVGSVITIYTVWDEVPNGYTVTAGTQTTVTIRPPEVTNITNSWGSPTVSGAVSGS